MVKQCTIQERYALLQTSQKVSACNNFNAVPAFPSMCIVNDSCTHLMTKSQADVWSHTHVHTLLEVAASASEEGDETQRA